MARKFMKVRRIVIPFITLVILTSQLAGCATLTSQEMIDESRRTPEVALEYSELATGQQDMDDQQVKTEDGTYDYEFDGDNSAIGVADNQQEQDQKLQEISHDELIKVFEKEYDISKSIYNSDDEETISSELEMIKLVVENMDKTLPSDYEAQYRAWRPSVTQQQEQAAPEVTLTFTEVNETVWATGTVNIRSGPSTEDAKVGSLNKGNSVTRIGVGTGDYSSWSKVKLSDGTEVYVASSYLTTTKPSTGGAGGGSTGGKGSTGGTSTTGGQTQQPVQQDPSSVDKGTSQMPSYREIITDSSQIDSGMKNIYENADKVTIGYGG